MKSPKKKSGLLDRLVPIYHWLPRYDKSWFAGDIVAGLSVWALMVLQAPWAMPPSAGRRLARLKQAVRSILERDGVDRIIARDRIHARVFDAVKKLTANTESGAVGG